MDSPKAIGRRIKRLRTERGWSQHDLAVNAQTTNATISRLETGQSAPRRKTALRLAEAFGVAVGELVGDEVVQEDQLQRIERKLDLLIARLAEDAEVVRLPPPKPRPSSRPNREGR